MITGAVEENLRLVLESTKRARMNEAGTVTLEFSAISVPRLGNLASARLSRFLRGRSERLLLVRFHLFPRLPSLRRRRDAMRTIYHSRKYSSLSGLCEPEVRLTGRAQLLNFPHCRQGYDHE